ncbi:MULTISPECIES: hypothetical protein [Parachlamydia]|jgi:hypothetical protein|uniref:Uncharacterized protein n=2 Tax=Parachlamydia acanthamoebae TaxID=83552 RepID=F8KYN3_PARAV|nr:hypothetical protein [Parachlamydia acanthamoebae]EFB41148.1 hypothetical protein pah_c050o125 [Parachlamydia acanthamoebae str. Hall's coccus]KIA78286.1 hypothetical protein DB43_EI00310 [Parachlamydia acanthamoebae]CCB85988.1 putative uncharacterized protein [Parachlamydia acanthamoebae UV-7]
MSDFTTTLIIAFFAIIVALLLLGLGWLLTGKSKIKPGSCGRDPTQKKDNECGDQFSCTLCDKNDEKKS